MSIANERVGEAQIPLHHKVIYIVLFLSLEEGSEF
jgi:hypothetical protein